MEHTRAAMLLSLAATSLARTQSAGQWVVNVGWIHPTPQDSSQPLTVHALGRSTEMPGSGSTLANANTFALTTRYLVTNHVALRTVLGVPPKLHLSRVGPLAPVDELGAARTWSPATRVQYHLDEPNAYVRPYLGVGLGCVWYRDIELSRPLATGQILASLTTGSMLVDPTVASLSKSFAPIVGAGSTYNLDAHWSISASVLYIWLSTKMTLTTQVPADTVTTTTKVRISPLTSFPSVEYRSQRPYVYSDTNRAVVQLESGDGTTRCTGLLGRGICRHGDFFRHRRVLLRDSFDLAHCDVDLLDAGVLLGGGRRNLSRQFSRRPLRSPWRPAALLRLADAQARNARPRPPCHLRQGEESGHEYIVALAVTHAHGEVGC